MSWQASAHVRAMLIAPDGKRLSRTEKLLLFVLADFHNVEKGFAFPSLRSIARDALLSKRQAQRVIRCLESKGVIEIESRTRENGSITSSRYTFPNVNDVDDDPFDVVD